MSSGQRFYGEILTLTKIYCMSINKKLSILGNFIIRNTGTKTEIFTQSIDGQRIRSLLPHRTFFRK